MTKTKTALKGRADRATSADAFIADPNATVILTGAHGCDGGCPSDRSNEQPANDGEQEIRALAHSKWEAAGSPAGDGVEFWLAAEREVGAKRPRGESTQE